MFDSFSFVLTISMFLVKQEIPNERRQVAASREASEAPSGIKHGSRSSDQEDEAEDAETGRAERGGKVEERLPVGQKAEEGAWAGA